MKHFVSLVMWECLFVCSCSSTNIWPYFHIYNHDPDGPGCWISTLNGPTFPSPNVHSYVCGQTLTAIMPHASISVQHTSWVLVVQHMPILLSGWRRRWCLHVSVCASVLDKLPTLWPLQHAKYQINALSVNLRSHCVRWQGSQFLDQHANCVLVLQHLSYAG